MSQTKRGVVPLTAVFLVLTVVLSSIFWTLAIWTGNDAGGGGAYAVGSMWCPGTAALITYRLFRLPFHDFGWGWPRVRFNLLAYLVPLGYATVAYAIIWMVGLGGVPSETFITRTRALLGWPNTVSAALVVAGWFALLSTTGVLRGVTTALGEEIGWRGFLAPLLVRRYGFTAGALTTGGIWAVWHLPILCFSNYNSGTPWWFSLPCFTVLVLGLSVISTWLRERSGSVWPSAILHASHNAFIQAFFTPLTTRHGPITAYAIDEFGFVLPLLVALIAVVFWIRRPEA